MAGRGKTSSGRKKPAGKAAASPGSSPDSPEDRVIDAALRLAAAGDWRAVGMARLAAEASVDMATLYELFPTPASVLVGLMRRIDRAVLATDPAEPAEITPVEVTPVEGSPRDRLFDVLMRRFDALQPFRAGLAAIARSGVAPLGGLALVGRFQRSMAWMLEAAGLASTGLAGRIRIAGLAVVYAQAFRVWLDDESADLGKTMAALDRGLAQAERWASTVPGVRSQRSGPTPDPVLE